MKTNNKIPFLNYKFYELLSTLGENYFTEKARQSLIFTLLRPFLKNRKETGILSKLQWLAYKILPDIRSDGRRLISWYSKNIFEKDFINWLSKHPSNRSSNLLIARVDDTKSGRKYGFRIPELQYLYDYVKKSKYKTHQLYVLMISLGDYDYILDFVFEKKDKCGVKIAHKMLNDFINRLSPDLRDAFKRNVRIALDGFYGKLRALEDFIKEGLSFVVKSGGMQKFVLPDGSSLRLKEIEDWMIKNQEFRSLNPCHKMDCKYAELICSTVNGQRLKLVLYKFTSKGKDRYLLLMTNMLDWHPFRILKTYKGRWPIETMFRITKQKLDIEKYSYNSKIGGTTSIEMFFSLRFILYMFLNHYRVKHTRRSRTSLKSVVESFTEELSKLSDKDLLLLFLGKLEIKSG